MKLYITKQLDFGTQIYTQKYTKHYYLIKLKNTIRFWYTNIHTKIYKFLIKVFSIPIIKFHIKNLHTIIISN
jgi:hypothetical protein